MSKRSRSSIKNDSNETISLKRGKPNSPSTVSNNSKMQSQQLTEFDYRYLKDSEEIASASCELLNCIRDLQSTEPVPICFDIQCEYNAESKKFGKTSVIQLCHDPSICFVFHVSDLESLPAEFLELLESTSVLLVGNSIKNNLNQLKNDFDELTVDDILEQCCDLGELANNVLNTGRQYTLATLLDILCKKTLNHNPNIRLSDWNTIPLSAAQKNYAATSVYMTHLIYAELKCIEMKSSNGILPMEINNENEPSLMNTAVLEEKTEKPVRRSTRSNTKIASPPRTRIVPEHVELPFIEYKGSIKYYTTMHDIASASDELLQWVNLQTDSVVPIAFDMEWPFSFQTGPGKSAVIQLCADVNVCYIFHLTDLKKLPAVLVALLNHDKVVCHGVNIKNDFRKLERDFTEVKVQKMIDQCLDLGVWCNSVLDTSGRWSMERLVRQICKLQISKDGKVRRSKWNVMPLTEPQQIYAAIDVYIAQVMYYKLKDIENKKLERLEEEREMRMAA